MESQKIVIAAIGDLHPAMALALELKARGHQIAFATSAVYKEKIEQAGINYYLLRPDLPEDSGTTAQALRAGVPMLVVPFNLDRPDNAARVVCLGVRRTISRKKYQHNLVVKELQLLLNNSQYKTKALEIAQIMQSENGVKTACDEIEAFLN